MLINRLGWNRAGTCNLNIRYAQMTMGLLAQAAMRGRRSARPRFQNRSESFSVSRPNFHRPSLALPELRKAV